MARGVSSTMVSCSKSWPGVVDLMRVPLTKRMACYVSCEAIGCKRAVIDCVQKATREHFCAGRPAFRVVSCWLQCCVRAGASQCADSVRQPGPACLAVFFYSGWGAVLVVRNNRAGCVLACSEVGLKRRVCFGGVSLSACLQTGSARRVNRSGVQEQAFAWLLLELLVLPASACCIYLLLVGCALRVQPCIQPCIRCCSSCG